MARARDNSLFVMVILVFAGPAFAQTTTNPTATQPNINQILQALQGIGGLGALGGLGGLTGQTTTNGITTGGTTPGGTTPSTTGGQRTPSIVSNQFTANSAGALSQRRPGLMLQQSIALQNGQLTLPGTPGPTLPFNGNFLQDTLDKVGLAIIGVFRNLLNTANTALGAASGLSSLTGTTTSTSSTSTISNPSTTGAGTTTSIQ